MSVWPDANAYSDCNGDTDGYTHANCDSYSDGNCDSNSDFNSNCYVYIDTKAYSHAEACTITEASPDPGTAPVTFKFAQSVGGIQIARSNSRNAVNLSSARTMNRFPSSRCVWAIQIMRRSESKADTQPVPASFGAFQRLFASRP